MKGVIFTAFVDMVESEFSPAMADAIISDCDLPSRGAYTAVGYYDASELVALAEALAVRTDTPVPTMHKRFGRYLAGVLAGSHPAAFEAFGSVIEMAQRLDDTIHPEVQKLYPDAELPSFEVESAGRSQCTVIYRSARGMVDVAEGLMWGVADHYGERIHVTRETLADGTRFRIERG